MIRVTFATFTALMSVVLCSPAVPAEKVVLIHGLARTPRSMSKMAKTLGEAGFEVTNIGYPSRSYRIEELSLIVRESIACEMVGVERVHIVTHSLGGILVRYIQQNFPLENIGRVVMLSPPNQGSEVVDKLGDMWLFKLVNGPAGSQLGTSPESFLEGLGAVDFELGIITGDRSINWILSLMIPGKDDGKVSVERARVGGMDDFKIVHATHPFIMKKKSVIREVVAFLNSGNFL